MVKNDGAKVWFNRIVAFLAGGALALIVGYFGVSEPLKAKNNELTKQIDEIKNGAPRLLSEAKSYIEAKDYTVALNVLNTLFEEQPGSAEAVEGKKLAASIEASIAQRDLKWEAAFGAIKTSWEKTIAKELRTQLEKDMPETLDRKWEGAKDSIRKEWEDRQL